MQPGWMRILAGAAVVALLAQAARAGEPQGTAYTLRFDRPVAVGDVYEIAASKSTTKSARYRDANGERPGPAESTDLVLQGTNEYTAVDPDKSYESILTVKKLQGPGVSMTDSGLKVRIVRDADGVRFTDESGPALPLSVQTALSQFFFKVTPGKARTDDLFPPKGPRKVGESWDVNKEAIAKEAAAFGLQVDAQNVKGTATLSEVKKVDGVEYVVVGTKTTCGVDRVDGQAENMTYEASDLTIEQTWTLPADPAKKGMELVDLISNKATAIDEKTQGRVMLTAQRTIRVKVTLVKEKK